MTEDNTCGGPRSVIAQVIAQAGVGMLVPVTITKQPAHSVDTLGSAALGLQCGLTLSPQTQSSSADEIMPHELKTHQPLFLLFLD